MSIARDGAVFYSGKGNRELAEQFANDNDRTTLEMTDGGSWLDKEKLFGEDSPLTRDQASKVWATTSQRYAEGASGQVTAFTNGSRAESVFNTVEHPALQNNPNVTGINWGN